MIPLTLPPIPLSPCLIAPISMQHPACCCVPGRASSTVTARDTSWHLHSACPVQHPFPKHNPSCAGGIILTSVVTRQEQQWGEEVLHQSVRPWPTLWPFLRTGMGWGTSRWHRVFTSHCEVQPQLPCLITSKSYKLAERWDRRRIKSLCIVISISQLTSNF